MAVSYSHFPHPILSKNRDDYLDSKFEVTVNIQKVSGEILFIFEYLLENPKLGRFLKEGKIDIVYRIECSETMYRELFKSKGTRDRIFIKESYLNGKIEISSYIVAKEPLNKYSNKLFHPDYDGLSFDIDRANILGIGNRVTMRLDKDIEELYNIPSIFTISKNENEDEKDMKINYDGNKINIILNKEDYVYQQNLAAIEEYQPILHTMIIMPALIYIFKLIEETDLGDIEFLSEKRWFKVIDGVLRKLGLKLDKSDIHQYGAYWLSQIILDYPLNRALSSLTVRDEEEL